MKARIIPWVSTTADYVRPIEDGIIYSLFDKLAFLGWFAAANTIIVYLDIMPVLLPRHAS